MGGDYYLVSDTSIFMWAGASENRFFRLMGELKAAGYAVGECPRIKADYPSLSPSYRYVSRPTPAGLFECEASWHPAGFKLECYQNVVFDNPAGGRYDFRRLEKMPFLIRMRWLAFRRLVSAFLERERLSYRPQREDLPTPLDRFNHGWSSHRFSRGPDGWPDAEATRSWKNLNVTADGVPIAQGMLAYGKCDRTHRWVCGVLHGGINGMWQMYDRLGETVLNHTGSTYFANPPADLRGRQVGGDRPHERRKFAFRKAMMEKNYRKVSAMAAAAARHGFDLGV